MNAETENTEEVDLSMSEDFDLNDASKPGLFPKGTYIGELFAMKVDIERMKIQSSVRMKDNGDDRIDNQDKPIDGQIVYISTWLPKKGDGDVMTSKGDMTKRQSKINMLGQFFDNLNITGVSTLGSIQALCESGDYLRDDVRVKIAHNTYEGETNNEVKRIWVPKEEN